jgi:hypothetical protein
MRALSLAPLAALSLLVACGDKDAEDSGPGGVACTEEARSSVTVALVDAAGAPIPAEAEPVVEYAVDGGAAVPCDSLDGGASFVCGYEVDGALTISASATGFAPASEVVEVPMTEDGCHVVSQSLTLALSPA